MEDKSLPNACILDKRERSTLPPTKKLTRGTIPKLLSMKEFKNSYNDNF